MPPYIILKNPKARTSYLESPFPDYAVLRQTTSGFVNEDILKDFIERIIANLRLESDEVLYVILDRCKVHMRESIKRILDDKKILYSFIPSGSTWLV